MENREVDMIREDYAKIEKELDEQILLIVVLLAELHPAVPADQGESSGN